MILYIQAITLSFIFWNWLYWMINSYFRTSVVKPTSSQTSLSNVSSFGSTRFIDKYNNKHKKYRLIIILFQRATQRCMKSYWDALWQQDRKTSELIGRMLNLCDKNLTYSLFLGLERIKQKSVQKKTN
jgi:hypothetical protein